MGRSPNYMGQELRPGVFYAGQVWIIQSPV